MASSQHDVVLREEFSSGSSGQRNGTRMPSLGCKLRPSGFNQGVVATLKLPVSKTDPGGRGSARALGCCCKDLHREWLCPYHTLYDLVTLRSIELESLRLEDVPPATFTLVGRKEDPTLSVEKQDMVAGAQRHAAFAAEERAQSGRSDRPFHEKIRNQSSGKEGMQFQLYPVDGTPFILCHLAIH